MRTKTRTKASAPIGTSPKELGQAQARKITDQIKSGLGRLDDLIEQAFTGKAWKVLHNTEGNPYRNWDEYVVTEFGDYLPALPREKRQEKVASLSSKGWSTRAIAPIVGVDQKTVHNDIQEAKAKAATATEENSSDHLSPVDAETVDPEPVVDAPTATVHSLDGRERPATQQRQPKSKDQDIVTFARKIATRLDTLNVDMDTLFAMPGAKESVEVQRLLRNRIDSLSNAVELYMQPTKVTA